MDVVGLILVVFLYAFILVCGVFIARYKGVGGGNDDLILAGRNLGLVVGICTLVATEVGGAFINATAEEVNNFVSDSND
jgi:high affinity choline transporter 7